VGTLLSSPLSEGLFHKAISQSGSGILGTRSLRDNSRNRSAEDIGLELAEHFGVDNDGKALENLRKIPAEEFIQISDSEKDANLISNVAQVVDGYVFPYMFNEAYRNSSTHNVPYITGFNANEGTTLVPLIFPEPIFEASFSGEDWLDEFWEILLDGFSGEVPESVTAYVNSMEGSDYDAAAQVWGDIWFGGPAYYSALKRSDDGLKTYLYFFERAVPSEKQTIGATHALELAYIFGSFFPFVARDDWDDELSEIMLNDWTEFAKTGVPNDSWPEFSSEEQIARIYGDNVYEGKLKDYKVFEALADYFNKF
jgi:para-nitrobenzyl esterase